MPTNMSSNEIRKEGADGERLLVLLPRWRARLIRAMAFKIIGKPSRLRIIPEAEIVEHHL